MPESMPEQSRLKIEVAGNEFEPSRKDNEVAGKEFELSIINNEPSIIDNDSAEKNLSIQERIWRLQEKK